MSYNSIFNKELFSGKYESFNGFHLSKLPDVLDGKL